MGSLGDKENENADGPIEDILNETPIRYDTALREEGIEKVTCGGMINGWFSLWDHMF